jgi:hypothetical protein
MGIWRQPAHTASLARNLGNLGKALAEVGEHRAALAATQECVDLYRDLATAEPAAQEDAARRRIAAALGEG